MNDTAWRNLSLFLGLCCAVLLGVAGALMLTSGSSPSATATLTPPSASASSGASSSPSGGASPTATQPPASPTASPSPTPSPTQSAPSATIRFSGLALDAQQDPQGTLRTFSFMSDGPGPVVARVVATSPQGSTRLCAKVDQQAASCWTAAKPAMPTGYADTDHSLWTFTLVGVGQFSPTVDVEFSWPATVASIQFTHGRFQGVGTDVPQSLNGFAATFKTRAAGSVGLQASWPPLVTDAEVTLADMTGTAIQADQTQYSGKGSLSPAYAQPVEANRSYLLTLHNLSADNYRPDLSATITFP